MERRRESTREGKKAHDFDVFSESFGVVVDPEVTKEEKENTIKET